MAIDPTTDDRLRRLEEAHLALLERTAVLESENRTLRDRAARTSAPSPAAPTADDPAVARRHLLRTGLAAAGAAAAGAVLLPGTPAAAADGDALLVGQPTDATSTTSLVVDGNAAGTDGLRVVDGQPLTIPPVGPTEVRPRAAVVGEARTRFGAGVLGVTETGTGVRAHSRSGRAVMADTETGTALLANVFDSGTAIEAATVQGWALKATATEGEGIRAEGQRGILAISQGGGAAVYASAWSTGPALETAGRSVFNGQGGPDLHLPGRAVDAGPADDGKAHAVGEIIALADGTLLHCTAPGTPGTWRTLSGPAAAGAFHVLAAPARAYDSRAAGAPAVGPKTPLAANEVRTIDLNAAGAIVPVDATAVQLTVLLVNATSGSGNATVWAAGRSKPLANTLVWGGSAGRHTATAVSAVTEGRVRVHASLRTNVVIDVVGYYR